MLGLKLNLYNSWQYVRAIAPRGGGACFDERSIAYEDCSSLALNAGGEGASFTSIF